MAYVAEVLLSHHGPALLCGDFNHDLQQLPASQLLRQAGYVSILDLHQMLYGTTMPCTFKEQSTRDLILVSTELVGHVTSIGVQQHREFPGHKPVIVTFDLPKGGLTKRMWKAPSNWQELQPKKELIAKSYEQLPDLTFTSDSMMDLQQWSRKVEDSVDMAIAMHHDLDSNTQPYSGLPSEYRGRFQPSNITTKHFRSFAPKARQGDFEPFTEVKTIKATQYVRQLRRLQSLRRRMLKVRTYPMVWHSTWVGLEAEWQAVLAAPGFHGSFTQWVCYHLQWPFLPHTLPNVDILEALEEAVQSLVNHKLKIDADRHQKKMFVNHQIDHLFNFDRDSYSKLREPPTQFIQALQTEHTLTCQIQAVHDGFVYGQIHGRVPTRAHMEFWWGDQQLQATCDQDYILAANQASWPNELSTQIGTNFQITIRYLGMQPTDIHDALEQYWKPIWQRDTHEQATDAQAWEEFQQILDSTRLPALVEHFDHTSLRLWWQVPQDSNFHSAPGSDGWRYQELAELPDIVLGDLIRILTSSHFKGFPSSHMTARVVSLPKKDNVEEARYTRPITILPTLYRVWSAVITKVMMQNAETKLDEALVGFVQRRSGLRSMYDLCWKIEKAHHDKICLAGLTLDLTKAFNQFPRQPIKLWMEKLGLPSNIAECWLNSLNNLRRHFDHRGWASSAVSSTTGVPDRDGMSILCMLAIAQLWVTSIHDQDVQPMAYADNLSWSSSSFEAHAQTLSTTIHLFRLLKIPIDWDKTWVWTTNSADADQWKQISQQILPEGCELEVRQEAMDLGVSMNYSSHNRLNDFSDKLQQVTQRLEKLFRENYSLPLTAKLIQTAVWTKIFYGREVGLLGRHHFQTLRVLAARALTHRFQSGIAALAVTLASNQLDDPEIYVVLNAVRAAQHFLSRVDNETKNSFLFVASRGTGVPNSTKGPAGALKGYLMRIGANIDKQGDIHFHSGLILSILHTPFPTLRNLIRQEWMTDLIVLHSERKAFQGSASIDRRLTIQMLTSFPDHQQKSLLCEIVHAFQTQNQKARWTGEDAPDCPYCPKMDTRKHRLTCCDALQHVYDRHKSVVEELLELDDINCDLPVIFVSPYRDFLLQCHFQQVPDVFVDETVMFVEDLLQQDVTPIFFSDGSCFESKIPGYGLASWAIVVCKAHKAEDLEVIGGLSNNLGLAFSSFLTLATSRCHGDQSIDRAELAAIVALHEKWPKSHLVTDSAYVIAAHQLVHTIEHPRELSGRANQDLLHRLWTSRSPGHQLTKVRSHTLEQGCSMGEQQNFFHVVGNALADTVAKKANLLLGGDMVQLWQQELQSVQHERRLRRAQYLLMLDIQPARTKLERQDKLKEQQDGLQPPLNMLRTTWPQQLKEWQPTSTFSLDLHWPADVSFDNQWGEQTTAECIQWLNSLRWPTFTTGSVNTSGATWAELFMDFLVDRRHSARVPGHGSRVIMETSLYRFKSAGHGFHHAIKSFYYLISWIDRALQGSIFNMLPRGHVGSLQRQGCTNKHHGVRLRPILTNATSVVAEVQHYRDRASNRFSGLTRWPWSDEFFSDLWEES